MTKILFLIHDLGHGGAEKVLVNLVNNMDRTKFDITVMALFGGGVNEQFLSPEIRYISCFKKAIRGNSHLMKLLTPRQLHKWLIKEHYDIEISYLEGPSARIISGCTAESTKLVCWIHSTMKSTRDLSGGFQNYREAVRAYQKFHCFGMVSNDVKTAFQKLCPLANKCMVLYNTNNSVKIIQDSMERIEEQFQSAGYSIIGVGKIVPNKGFDRLARIHKRLREDGLPVHTYILGTGPQREDIEAYLRENGLTDSFTFLGYQTNPYRYVASCDLFVCCSHSEGFSTAATEALIVGTPICTVEVSGMKEMLGMNNEYGMVTANDEDALYDGIRLMLTKPGLLEHYRTQAKQRGMAFRTEETVQAVEEMLRQFSEESR